MLLNIKKLEELISKLPDSKFKEEMEKNCGHLKQSMRRTRQSQEKVNQMPEFNFWVESAECPHCGEGDAEIGYDIDDLDLPERGAT